MRDESDELLVESVTITDPAECVFTDRTTAETTCPSLRGEESVPDR